MASIATPHTSTDVLPTGNRYAAILRLAMPTVIAMVSQSAVNEVDIVFFGQLPNPESSNAQAALMPSLILVWLFGGSLGAISVGAQALTARRYAEGDEHAAGKVLANAAWFTIIAGAVMTVTAFLALPYIVKATTTVPAVGDIMLSYSQWRMGGIISLATTMAIKAFFDGIGRTSVHLVAAIVMNVCNVALCWLFIFGNLGMPRMGAEGAGLAAFISTYIGLFVMLVYGWGVRAKFRPVRWSNLDRRLTMQILRLSIPAALATVAMMGGFWLFSKVASRLDQASAATADVVEAVNGAATTNIVGVLKLTFTACIGFGTATATLVSQGLGLKKPEEAAAFGWSSVRLGLLVFGVIGLCEGVLFTGPLIHLIAPKSPAVQEAMMMPMRMVGIVTPVISIAMILSEALFGAGNTRFVAITQGLLVFGVLVPGAYILAVVVGVGLNGVWIAACVYAVLAAVAMSMKFAGGTWKSIKL